MQGSDICDYNKCTGCSACINICPRKCIRLVEDEYGETHPYVNQGQCINCNLCKVTCPNNNPPKYYYPMHCYAAWITDAIELRKCASGGIGTTLSRFVIAEGGIVFGSRYDQDLNPIITWTDNGNELDCFKGSRYVQSQVANDTYLKVRKFLNDGRLVLFIGTPCQIAGLLSFLHRDYDRLITCDLICHGVSPSAYLKQEVSFLSQSYCLDKISDIRFRGNDGNDFRMTLWDEANQRLFPRNNIIQRLTLTDYKEDYYLKAFLQGISLRENCYDCNYAKPSRISDITIGDFIGLGKKEEFGYESNCNISSVTTNTEKGLLFLRKVAERTNTLKLIERKYSERLEYKPSLIEPFPKSKFCHSFREDYKKNNFPIAIRKTLFKNMKAEYISILKRKYSFKGTIWLIYSMLRSLLKSTRHE